MFEPTYRSIAKDSFNRNVHASTGIEGNTLSLAQVAALAEKYHGRKISLTPKQSELLEYLEKQGTLGSAQICRKMNINRARVNQLIMPLIKSGIVIKEGVTRAALYRLA